MSSKRNRKTLGQSINLTFEQVLDSLLDETRPFHPRNLYRFSDLEEEDLRKLENAWPLVSARRRQAILEDIEELGETNYTLSFEAFCTYTVSDEDTRVRELSVRGLWEYENRSLIPLFMDLLANDSQAEVRAVSATALGKFIYLGEIEEIPEQALDEIVDRLLEVHHSSDTSLVRRRALESLGFSSRDEITNLIEAACNSGKQEWIVSALFAMGRSANSRWADHVLDMLESSKLNVLCPTCLTCWQITTERPAWQQSGLSRRLVGRVSRRPWSSYTTKRKMRKRRISSIWRWKTCNSLKTYNYSTCSKSHRTMNMLEAMVMGYMIWKTASKKMRTKYTN
jgi:hypothetical protein